MNHKIISFIKELKEFTGDSFIYSCSVSAYGFQNELDIKYQLSSNLNGFSFVQKDTEQELIDVLPLVREQVRSLMDAKELKKQIDVKLITSSL